MFGKLTIVGVGLLGGSIGLAAKQHRLAQTVVGWVRRESAGREAIEAGALDSATLKPEEAASGADFVVLCGPVSQIPNLASAIAPFLESKAIMTDVGSVKGQILAEILDTVPNGNSHFVGSHPMAGSEKSGVSAARGDLFQDASCVVTTDQALPENLDKVEAFWRALGANPLRMAAKDHDRLVSQTSHLPHLAASMLAACFERENSDLLAKLCGPGFFDTTRIASGHPQLWKDIFFANRQNLLADIEKLLNQTSAFQKALLEKDEDAIIRLLEKGKWNRDKIANSPRI